MIAARQLSVKGFRCNSCSISLLNSLSSACGTNVQFPIRAITNTHLQASDLPQRAFHNSTLRFGPTEIVGSIVELAYSEAQPEQESELQSQTETQTETTEKESVLEDFKEKELVDGAKLVAEATLSHIAINGGHAVAERKDHATPKEKEPPTTKFEKEALAKETGLVTAKTEEEQQEQVPWFLRVEPPRPTSHPFAQRQALPELPNDPPPALRPLLKHLSEELGIYDIALIDLRSMDPPPAIGADTIMVLGNARSERHLHVSADKTCRWLRSEWKMAPYADGLLGRNELKIKNRRLRKKGKLVSTQTGVEEGVGWICVDVGSQGLVVQLFTPHRREEIDLEELWGKYLKNGGITRSPRFEPVLFEEELVGDVEEAVVRYSPSVPTVRLGAGLSTGSSYFNTKRRSFHTTTPRRILETIMPTDPLNPRSYYNIDGIRFHGIEVPRIVKKGSHWQLIKQLPPTYTPNSHNLVSELVLRAHINHLKIQFPGLKSIGSPLLGSGPEDKASTDFLKTFHYHLPKPPTLKGFQLQLEFLIEAHRISPAQYPTSCFLPHLDSMLASSIPPPPEFYYLILRAFSESSSHRNKPLPREEITGALLAVMNEVVSHMKLHCRNSYPYAPEFMFCFLRALTNTKLPLIQHMATTICNPKSPTPDHLVEKYSSKLRMGSYYLDRRIHTLDMELREANFTYTLREYQETLLTAYAMGGAWIAFWNVWMRLRYRGVHRDENFYALVVGLLVIAKNQNECVYALRTLVNGMGRELPGVKVTEGLANGILKLLEIAEGTGARVAAGMRSDKEVDMRTEWKALREKCEAVITRERLKKKKEI